MSETAVALGLGSRLLPVTGDPRALSSDARRRRADFPVGLVSLPWASPWQPSVALGLLAAIGRSHGFPVATHHIAPELMELLTPDEVRSLAFADVAEWLFGVAAFDDTDPEDRLLAELGPEALGRLQGAGLGPGRLRKLRHELLPEWIERLAARTDWGGYRVVGFSATFKQTAASFALARHIKRKSPGVKTVFGGASFDTPMGEAWMQGIPWIDVAVSGEADRVFPTLLVALSEDRSPAALPGVLARAPDGSVTAAPPDSPLEDLDSLPIPVYDEFFARAARVGLGDPAGNDIAAAFEGSRGCWWGERSHCTFCGLNGTTMRYRSKSPQRVRAELDELAARHGVRRFHASDNILDRSYLPTLVEGLAADGAPYSLFFEIKANLSRDEIRRLGRAGIEAIQPGIESLSSRVLALMRKGVRASTNVNLLRWATQFGITVAWNLLWGFPGEREEDVTEQARLLPALAHLPPPWSALRIEIDRYSPIFRDRDRFTIHGLRGRRDHRFAFPASVDYDATAYHFDGQLEGALPDECYEPLVVAVDAWRAAHAGTSEPSLTVQFNGDTATVADRRFASERRLELTEAATTAYRACFGEPTKRSVVMAETADRHGEQAAQAAIGVLEEEQLVMRDGNLVVALALPGLQASQRERVPRILRDMAPVS